jgi:tripartite-type tricarboxylate transporter receptor subunit TctC
MPGITRRCFAALAAVAPFPALAQSWPEKPIRLVVPLAPGGLVDLLARALAPHLQAELGQPFVVENRAGAGGNVGADHVAKSPADGYTLLLSPAGPLAINGALYPVLPFDPATAFAPVALVLATPMLLVVRADQPWRDVAGLLAAARAAPGRLAGASGGNGTTPHLALELFKAMAKVDITHVPYRGQGPATTALLGGEVQLMFDTAALVMPHLRGGAVRALGVTSARRIAALPEVPTIAESGVPRYESSSWFGLVAPSGTPAPVVARLAEATASALRRPEVVSRFGDQAGGVLGGGGGEERPEAFAAFIAAERVKWAEVVRASGARAD